MHSVIQHGVDVVPHGWSEQILAAVKQPETGRTEKEEAEKRKDGIQDLNSAGTKPATAVC